MTTEKQQTPLQKLIAKLKWRIERYPEFNQGEKDVASILALQDAESLLPEEKQMVIDGYEQYPNMTGEEYYHKTYETH